MGRMMAQAVETAKEYSEVSTVHGINYIFSSSVAKVLDGARIRTALIVWAFVHPKGLTTLLTEIVCILMITLQ